MSVAVTRTRAMTTIRASALGGCERELALSWMGVGAGDRPASLRGAMDVSAGLEDALLDRLRAKGYHVTDPQHEVTLDIGEKVRVVGHLDGLARKDGRSYVAEVKAFGDELYQAASADVASWSEQYAYQVSVYMHATGLPAVFLVGHKKAEENGAVSIVEEKVWMIEAPPIPLDAIRDKVERIADHVARLDKPRAVRCIARWGCPMFTMGYCDARDEVAVEVNLELEEWADTYERARMQKRVAEEQMKEAHTEVMRLMGGRDKVAVRGFGLTVYESVKKDWDKEAVTLALKECGKDAAEFTVERVSKSLRITKKGDE